MSQFSDMLRRRREAAGLGRDELARRLGVSGGTVYRWEKGADLPSGEHRPALARFLRIPTRDLEQRLEPQTETEQSFIEDRLATLESRVDQFVSVLSEFFDHVSFDDNHIALVVGQRRIEIDGAEGSICLSDGDGNRVRMDDQGVRVAATVDLKLDAATIHLASAKVDAPGAVVEFHNLLKCSSLHCNYVEAGAYAPAAGNIW